MTHLFKYITPDDFDNLLIQSDGKFLTGVRFSSSQPIETKHILPLSSPFELPQVLYDTCKWLDIYFSGRQPDFTPSYRMDNLTPFRKTVLNIVCEIAYGQMMTYGEIAKHIAISTHDRASLHSHKMSAQAVGGAIRWNPINIIVPCHRVMGTNGKLTGFNGGIKNKIALLQLEGLEIKG